MARFINVFMKTPKNYSNSSDAAPTTKPGAMVFNRIPGHWQLYF